MGSDGGGAQPESHSHRGTGRSVLAALPPKYLHWGCFSGIERPGMSDAPAWRPEVRPQVDLNNDHLSKLTRA